MSKHRSSHREARRRGRIGALSLSLAVTIVVGGVAVGVLPQVRPDRASAGTASTTAALTTAALDTVDVPKPKPKPTAETASVTSVDDDPAVPAASGTGRRIVFDQSDQRVWLVNADQTIDRTYLVSGSRFDNLHPGTYSVLSRSRYATSFDYTGKLEYFVRFATGYSAPIGFHAVPRYNNGELEQTKAQLGTPLSAGCVRQWMPDAVHLWNWAPIGTKVVVTA